jgi:putative membrane protein
MYQRRSNPKWILIPVLAVFAIAAALTGLYLYFHNTSPPTYYYGPRFGWWFGWPFFGFGWFFIPLLFFLIFFVLRWIFWGGCGWARGCWYYHQYYDPALEILRERFAKGEITKEQFDDMVRNLRGNLGGENKI